MDSPVPSRILTRQDYEGAVERLILWERAYYIDNKPLVADVVYDGLFDLVRQWEVEHPGDVLAHGPTQRVSSDLVGDFPEFTHTIPVLSLDKAYTAGEIGTWVNRCATLAGRGISFVAEEKIDGLSIVLYYEAGVLVRGVTRGNGSVGNDVSANVRTLRDVPLRLARPISGAFRGEVYMGKADFATLNAALEQPYSNPRNFAGGTLRRISPAEVSKVPLRIFVYEGFYEGSPDTHEGLLKDMVALGFRVNPAWLQVSLPGDMDGLQAWIDQRTKLRPDLGYEIDGLVIKVNDLDTREELGYTGHHPRWAIAYKFESPQGVSVLKSIDVQVGRTGRITPVARIEPVSIGGAMIQNVTLHNQDYINALELAPGDSIAVSRRGDVIPAIEAVIEKGEGSQPVWQLPHTCPSCSTGLVVLGAHHFCPNFDCPDRTLGRLSFFVGRDQMDIGGVGPETVEVLWSKGLVKDIPDLYTFSPYQLLGTQGFGDKKIEAMIQGIEASKSKPFRVVMYSVGIPDLGPKVVELLCEAGFNSLAKIVAAFTSPDVEPLLAIKGMGEKTITSLQASFSDPRVLALFAALEAGGLAMVETEAPRVGGNPDLEQIFAGQTWCVTGSFETYKPRDLAMVEVQARGGKVVGDVSGAVTHLLAGQKAGSKLAKAEKLGITVVDEAGFLALIAP